MQGYKNGQTPYIEFITKAPELIVAEITGMKHSKIKKENLDIYSSRVKDKEALNKKKDDIINFINQNLKV